MTDKELHKLIRQGTKLLRKIESLEEQIDSYNCVSEQRLLKKELATTRQEFNEIFDKVFGGEI